MTTVNIHLLGEKLLQKRAQMGIRAAAKEIGVSPATLSRVERGYLPDIETFTKICQWLQIDPSEVLGVGTTAKTSATPQVAVHFKKKTALAPATAQALGKMILAAHRAWLVTEGEGS